MSTCPNKNTPEWKALEKSVGFFEAYRDYMETDGLIRTPEEVQAKLDSRKPIEKEISDLTEFKNDVITEINQSISVADIAEDLLNEADEVVINVNEISQDRAVELANKMSEALGVDYQIVSLDEAVEITKDSQNPITTQSTFFYNGKVYFIKDRMTSEMVMHEFSHPLVRSLSKENPELFNNLYTRLSETKEGLEIIAEVAQMYLGIDPNDNIFKEEAIVIALQKEIVSTATKFQQVINNILYGLKQLLRNIFGKAIKISKLNSNTTLNELGNILTEGDRITIDTELLTEGDIVAFLDSRKEIIADLESMKHKDITSTVNTFYDIISTQLNQLLRNKNFEELAPLLTDEYLRGDFQAMKQNLKLWQTAVKDGTERLLNDVEENRHRAEALGNTLIRLESVMEKIYKHVAEIAESGESRDNVDKAYNYDKFLNHWGDFIERIKEAMTDPDNNISSKSPINGIITDIDNNIRKSRKHIDKMFADGARDGLYEQLEPLQRNLAERYESILKSLKDKKAPLAKIDAVFKEYHGVNQADYKLFNELSEKQRKGILSLKEELELTRLAAATQHGLSISKNKIEQILKGRIGDANFFNSYLEGYLYNTDPVVGGLALYIKNALNDAMITTQHNYNSFANDIQNDLKAAGVNFNQVGKIGNDPKKGVLFKDKVYAYNKEKKEYEVREVWRFKSQFKDFNYDEGFHRQEVAKTNEAYLLSPNDVTKAAYRKAKAAAAEFHNTYMNQQYTAEYYEREKIFNRGEDDLIGQEARFRRDEWAERLRDVTADNKTQMQDIDSDDAEDVLWREYAQMYDRYDLNGNLKIGDEALIAERLREHRIASRELHESKIRPGVFENAYRDFLQELIDTAVEKSSDPNSPWQIRLNQWKARNTRKAIKPQYYAKRQQIIDDIKAILSNLPINERKELDESSIWEEIFEVMGGYRDDNGQPIATDLTEGQIERIKILQLQLIQIQEESIQKDGLTKEERILYYSLLEKRKTRKISSDEIITLDELAAKKKTGLSPYALITLRSLTTQLQAMSTKEATDYYVDIVNNWMSKLNISHFKRTYKRNTIDNTTASLILDLDIVEDWMKEDADFREWFEANHILKVYESKDGPVEKYERVYAWSISKPIDPAMMESYTIKDKETGEVLDIIEGLPTMKYYSQKVKNQYVTRNILGVTKDNQGNYLPKSKYEMSLNDRLSDTEKYKYINDDYEKMRIEEPAAFKLLEKLKKHHLEYQEGLPVSSRLYLDLPRMRMDNLEFVQSGSLKRKGVEKTNSLTALAQRAKDFMTKGVDDYQSGVSNYDTDVNMIRADMFDNEMSGIPIDGLYDIHANDVSTNVTLSMMRYMGSAERQKQLLKMSPMARAIERTLEKNAVKDPNAINKQEMQNRGNLRFMFKQENVRLRTVKNLIAREFKGEAQAGFTKNVPVFTKFANLLFKRASFSFFAFNIPSALKNSVGMKFQQMIEASAGEYVDHRNLQKGNVWSYKTMAELSFSGALYSRKAKSHDLQMVDAFGMIPDRFEETVGKELSRTVLADAASMTVWFSPRKWVEIQATLQLAGGMLHKKKVIQRQDDGTDKEIDYMNAFETIDGRLGLKKGIDVRYGLEPIVHIMKPTDTLESLAKEYNMSLADFKSSIVGQNITKKTEIIDSLEIKRKLLLEEIDVENEPTEKGKTLLLDKIEAINKDYDRRIAEKGSITINNNEFKFIKNQMQQVNNNMGGAYAKFDQPEAQRYLLFRFITFMRRYFTTMAMNRWGFSGSIKDPRPRLNPGAGGANMGYYIQFAKTVAETVKMMGANLPYMTPMEKQAALKFGSEVALLLAITMITSLLFGWDSDDDDRYAKLRAKSGALGFLGLTKEDPDRPFNGLGFAEVQTLQLLMQIRGENEQFNPLTGGIKQYTGLLDLKSVALGPTTDSYSKIWNDLSLWVRGDEHARYSRNIGPYEWQDEGSLKIMNHTLKSFGFTGTSLDPALAIQNFQSFQGKR